MYAFPKKEKQIRLSVSLPADLVVWIRKTAATNNTSISAVVAYAIRQMKAEPIRQEIMRGLLEEAADHELDAETQAWMNAPMGRKNNGQENI